MPPLDRNGKSPSRGVPRAKNKSQSPGTRQALRDRSSKHNTQQHTQKKVTPCGKLGEGERVPEKQQGKQSNVEVDNGVSVTEEDVKMDALTEEPYHWLQQHLSQLNNANNRLGAKIVDEGHGDLNEMEDHHVNR